MAKMLAKVELLGCETHQARGRSFQRGKPQIITNPSDIAYYKAQSEFSVTMLADDTPEPAAEPATTPAAAPLAPSPDNDDTEDNDTEDDDAEDEDIEGDDETTPVYKKADLEKMNKRALIELAKDDFGMVLNDTDSKSKLVAMILKEQIARAN